jgi:hypothetical protein
VNEACEADAGDVATGAEDAFEVPDGFCAAEELVVVRAIQGNMSRDVLTRSGLRGRGEEEDLRLGIYLV